MTRAPATLNFLSLALKPVYKAPDELMANSVRDLLEQNGVPAIVHSFQLPAYDGLAMVMRPVWGEVLVEETDLQRAREMVDGFLSSSAGEDRPD